MRRFFRRMAKTGDGLTDFLGPRGDTVQIILKRQGVPEAAIYKDDEREIRSPSLQTQEDDASTDHNS